MINPDQIPDAVADSMREFFFCRGDAQKAIAAALNAWPDMGTEFMSDNPRWYNGHLIILPLTQEKSE
jgi:hypothetical protein